MLLTSNRECNIKLGHNKLHKYICSIGTSTGEGGIRHNPDKTSFPQILKNIIPLSTRYWKNVIRLVIYKDYSKLIRNNSGSGETRREWGLALGWTPGQELAIHKGHHHFQRKTEILTCNHIPRRGCSSSNCSTNIIREHASWTRIKRDKTVFRQEKKERFATAAGYQCVWLKHTAHLARTLPISNLCAIKNKWRFSRCKCKNLKINLKIKHMPRQEISIAYIILRWTKCKRGI